MNEKIKLIKRDEKPKPADKFIESHELSLLSLLIARHPDRARVFLERLKESLKAAA